MEEVSGRDLDEVGGPEFEAWVILVDIEHKGGTVPEVGSRHRCCNVLFTSLDGFGRVQVAGIHGRFMLKRGAVDGKIYIVMMDAFTG